MKLFTDLTSNQKIGFIKPLENFTNLLQHGHFSAFYQREQEIASQINSYYYKKTILDNSDRANTSKFLTKRAKEEGFRERNPLSKFRANKGLNNYTKIEEDAMSIKTLECSMNEECDDQDDKISVMNQSVNQQESPRLGKREPLYTALETGSNASRCGDNRTATAKVGKNNILTIKPSTPEWIVNFRIQEKERYKNPTIPWNYTMPDGNKVVVAPVCKKSALSAKPREHYFLKTERPSYITILCLVRDAAAKLPNGVGTRADICEMLKDSQFINENIPDKKIQ